VARRSPSATRTGSRWCRTRRFTSARDYADEVAAARLYGGVHYSFSIDVGRQAGFDIGRLAVERWFTPSAAR